jgi:hypothetical protein
MTIKRSVWQTLDCPYWFVTVVVDGRIWTDGKCHDTKFGAIIAGEKYLMTLHKQKTIQTHALEQKECRNVPRIP